MRLGIVNHHGRKPAGAEQALSLFLQHTPSTVEPTFFLFEDGEFADMLRRSRGAEAVIVLPMSRRISAAARSALSYNAVWDTIVLSKQLAAMLREKRIDAVLTNSMKAHVVGSLAAKAAGRPCITFMHDALHGSARFIIREISRFCSTERFACSHAIAEDFRLPRTTVIHSPIDMAEYRHLPSRAEARAALGLPLDGSPVIGLIGRILRWKGQDRFIRIAARVAEETDAHFAIIGGAVFGCDSDYPRELHELVEREGLQKRMHFIPWQENMRNAYAAIDVSCNCSTQEPFGRTTVEALACGVPVVCFDDAGVCEIFEQHRGGTKVPAGDEAAFAAAVVAYIRESATASETRAYAISAAERLDVGRLSQRFFDVVSRVGTAC